MDHYKRSKSYQDTAGHELIDFDVSKINEMAEELTIQEGFEDHPVTGVTWHGAQAYCKWKSSLEQVQYRLPTESEWEKAARGSLGRRNPWGNDFAREKCNSRESGIHGATRIGSFPDGRSPYGCHDMVGNVWDWCQDDFQSDFYEKGSKENPVGTNAKTGEKVLRGGWWNYGRDFIRCAYRFKFPPETRVTCIGFRCARTKK